MQNGTKIVPRWLQDSLLEGLGPQLGPRRQLNTKKHEFWTPSRPPLEPSWGPIFIFLYQKLNYWVYFWRFFCELFFEGLGMKKIGFLRRSTFDFWTTLERFCSFFTFSKNLYLDKFWFRFDFHFGSILAQVGAKLSHVGHYVGLRWLCNITQTKPCLKMSGETMQEG